MRKAKVMVESYDDAEDLSLPKELVITVPDDEEDIEEFLCDEISNITGFCHNGFTWELI